MNNKINLLGITISKVDHKISFNVYRKPTATDNIPNDSCHPPEQKLAAIRCLIICLSTYPMNETNKRKEYDIIKQILCNNKYDVKILNEITHTTDTQTQNEIKTHKKKGGGGQIHVCWMTNKIHYQAVYSNLKVSFKADITTGKLLAHNKNTNLNKFNKCGVYQLTCQDCNRKYIGQTGRLFHIGFQEHFRDFEYRNGQSKFAQHL